METYNCNFCTEAPNCEFLYETNGDACPLFELIDLEWSD